MGYSHGKEWTDSKITKGIKEVMIDVGIDTMPTKSITEKSMGNSSLTNAISKHGGFAFWADKLGLEQKGCETILGQEFEQHCSEFIRQEFDFYTELTSLRFPYDILVNKNIKIDVKVGKIHKGLFSMYSFNLEKRLPTCDVFVAYCIDHNKDIVKTYVIPSAVLSGMTQLSVGINKSKYDIYLDKWDILDTYDKFYKSLV